MNRPLRARTIISFWINSSPKSILGVLVEGNEFSSLEIAQKVNIRKSEVSTILTSMNTYNLVHLRMDGRKRYYKLNLTKYRWIQSLIDDLSSY